MKCFWAYELFEISGTKPTISVVWRRRFLAKIRCFTLVRRENEGWPDVLKIANWRFLWYSGSGLLVSLLKCVGCLSRLICMTDTAPTGACCFSCPFLLPWCFMRLAWRAWIWTGIQNSFICFLQLNRLNGHPLFKLSRQVLLQSVDVMRRLPKFEISFESTWDFVSYSKWREIFNVFWLPVASKLISLHKQQLFFPLPKLSIPFQPILATVEFARFGGDNTTVNNCRYVKFLTSVMTAEIT